MARFFLGYQNINRDMKPKAEQKAEVDRFVALLIAAGFPAENSKTMHTGVWIDITGTALTIKSQSSVMSLCDKESVLAVCDKNQHLFADPYVVYSFYPGAIKPLGPRLPTEATEDTEELEALSSSPSL